LICEREIRSKRQRTQFMAERRFMAESQFITEKTISKSRYAI
jgi:hypothetical protein